MILNEKRLRAAVRTWAVESGSRLRSRRKELGLSQAQLAFAAGVREQTISKAELGEIVPKDAVRMALVAVLLCEVSDIWSYPERSYVMNVAREAVA